MSNSEQSPQEMFASLWQNRSDDPLSTDAPASAPDNQPQADTSSENSELSPMDEFEQMSAEAESGEQEGTSEEDIAASAASEDSETSLPSSPEKAEDSELADIEEVFVKGANGRKQKLKIDYSDREATKKAHLLAAGMRKFQAERDAATKLIKPLETALGSSLNAENIQDLVSLKTDFDKIEKAFEEHGPKGIISLLGGDDAWEKAVNEELEHREYVSNLSAEEKYELKMKERDEQYQKQLQAERTQREQFQQQIQAKEEMAERQQLESKLHPAFDRYRFAGKLGDPATENLYDEAIWGRVKERLKEYPEDFELSQAVIDKEFRTVSSQFRKHIKTQTEKQVKKTVESKKAETAKRAQVAAKKGLSTTGAKGKVMKGIKEGNLKDVFNALYENR